MSHLKILNKRGPKIEPFGTPDKISSPGTKKGVYFSSLLSL